MTFYTHKKKEHNKDDFLHRNTHSSNAQQNIALIEQLISDYTSTIFSYPERLWLDLLVIVLALEAEPGKLEKEPSLEQLL